MEFSPLPVILLLISPIPVAHPQERPRAVLSVSPQSWLTEGDSVTLNCEVTDSSTDWKFSWYRVVPYRDDLTQITNNRGFIMYVEPLSDSSRGSGGSYTLSPVGFKHTGVYICRGESGEPAFHTDYSNPESLWITGESPPVSLIINPNRTQHFTGDSLSLSCEDQSNSTGWTVRRYLHNRRVLNCSQESLIGSTCKIHSISTVHNGHYWCHSETGGASNPVNISVHDGDVILESPVHPVTEGRPLTLRCLHRNRNSSKLQADFYKDGSVLQNQTTGEMIIHNVSKSDEGFYHCIYPERGESLKSWVSVRVLISHIPVAHPQDSSRGSGGSYTLSPVGFNHTGVYICRGERGEPAFHTDYSNPESLWITGESPPVSLIINPSRTQHFTGDSLSLSCEDQSNSTGWTVRRYLHNQGVLNCSQESLIGSTSKIYSISTVHNGHYWCHSETRGASNPVNISVHDGDVILESPVHPVTEGRTLTLHCLYRYTNSSNLRADFYKDGSVLQNQTTGEMIIHNVSKSDEGFYHCIYPERGESPKSWVSVRGSSTSGRAARVALGLSLAVWFNSLLILYILQGCRKQKKEKQQKGNQTSDQNQSQSETEDFQSGHTPLQAGADVETIASDVTYADLELKPQKKGKSIGRGKASVGDDTVYSEMKYNM